MIIGRNQEPDGNHMTTVNTNHQHRPTRQLRRAKGDNIDLHDLLTDDGELDNSMAKWVQHRREEGVDVHLWSPQGTQVYARQESRRMGIESLLAW